MTTSTDPVNVLTVARFYELVGDQDIARFYEWFLDASSGKDIGYCVAITRLGEGEYEAVMASEVMIDRLGHEPRRATTTVKIRTETEPPVRWWEMWA